MGTGHHHLGTAVILADLQHVDLDPLAVLVGLPGDHLVGGQDAVGLAQLHVGVALLHPLHDGGEDLVLLLGVLLVDVAALGLPDALDHHLLGGLGGDAPELAGVRLLLHDVAHLVEGVDLLGGGQGDLHGGVHDLLHHGLAGVDVDLAGGAVDLGPHVALGVVVALIGEDQGGFHRGEQHVLADPLLLFQRVESLDKICVHCRVLSCLVNFS